MCSGLSDNAFQALLEQKNAKAKNQCKYLRYEPAACKACQPRRFCNNPDCSEYGNRIIGGTDCISNCKHYEKKEDTNADV